MNSLLDGISGSGSSGTLRYCIGQANSTLGNDTINITVMGTITLANGQLTLSDTTGMTTITGPGANQLTIDANFASRVFQINSGVTAQISGVDVTNGRVSGDLGGGINNAGFLTITNCTVNSNSASGDGFFSLDGGGIYNSGTLAIMNSTIRGNSSGYFAGGIGNHGDLTVTNSTVSGNSAVGGGGICNNEGNLTVTNFTISGNSATGDPDNDKGGGIFNSYGPVTITSSTISGNTCEAADGGIYNISGPFTVANSIINGNSAGSDYGGGGIFNFGVGTFTVSNSTIIGNSAGNGGGICDGSDGQTVTIAVMNCTVSGNHANLDGGGILNDGESPQDAMAAVTNSTICGNSAIGTPSASGIGGGICNLGGTTRLANSTIGGNTADEIGGVYNAFHGTLSATNTIIAGNQAPTSADLQGTLSTNIDNLINMSAATAGLGTLGNYGGPTQTILLLPGSPAIDAGTSVGAPSTDQRGLPRFGPVDIGAFEVQAAVIVAGVVVNDGSAQRSEVRSLTVTFSGTVSFAGGNANAAAAFQLQHVQTGNNVTIAAAVSTNGSGQTVATLTFSGTETDAVSGQNGGQLSLADGRYGLSILSANVNGSNGFALDGDYDGTAGGNYVSPTDTLGGGPGELGLYRLFGDATGNGIVDQVDLGQFRSTFNANSSNSNYLAYLDADNSGVVDQVDLGQFRSRFNTNVFAPQTPNAAPTPPKVAAVEVNDGSVERSEVRSITVTFSGPVLFAGGNADAAAAFHLDHLTDSNDVALASAVSSNGQGQTVVTLTFSGAETDPLSSENGGMASLADGRYSLIVFSADVTGTNGLALNGGGGNGNYISPTDTLGGGPGQLHLFRLFGDAKGNG